MPLTRITLRRGRDADDLRALQDGVYAAMRAVFEVPEDDRFMMIDQKEAEEFSFGPSYLGIDRSDDLVIIEITANDTRGNAQKKALYREIAERLSERPGIRPEDIFINLVEVKPSNWSFGNGNAQYA